MGRSRRKSQKPSYSNDKNSANSKGSENLKGKDLNQNSQASNQESVPVPDKPTTNNDPAWYARDPALLRDAANLFFSFAFGKYYYINGSGKHMPSHNEYVGRVSVPGLCPLRLKPTLGFSDKATSPLNVSAASIYAYVRHLNSGRKNYDPADLFIYLCAIANIYSAIVWAERLYAFAFSYSNSNRYIGDSLLRSEGVDPVNFRLNLANFRMKLNEYINKISVFAVPSDITYFNKLAFMYHNVFLENGEGNIRDQIYYYVPDGFYKFALDADNLGCLDYKHWGYSATSTTLANWTDVIALLEDLIAGMFLDEDASLMSGDMFKVYGDHIIRLTSMDESVTLPIVYDPMILWQIKNSSFVNVMRRSISEAEAASASDRTNTTHSHYTLGNGRTQDGIPGCVFQSNDGYLMSVERLVDGATSGNYAGNRHMEYKLAINKIISSDLPDPDVGVIMESSRLIPGPHDAPSTYTGTETNKDLGWVECGSFIMVDGWIGQMQTGNTAIFTGFSNVAQYTLSGGVKTTIAYTVADIFMFKYAPMLYAVRYASSGEVDDYYPISDIANYCILDAASVTKLHEAALLSLLYVPGIARIG